MTPCFPPVLLSRTHVPITTRDAAPSLVLYWMEGAPPRSPASRANSAPPVLQVDTASVCGSFSACSP